jgi:ketosteroid isomerase-like protein
VSRDSADEVIRNAFREYERGHIDHLLQFIDPDLEWTYLDPGERDPDPRTCHGREDFAEALRRQAARGLKSVVEEVRSNGEFVMVAIRTPGVDAYRARQSDDRSFDVFTVHDGRVVAIRACRDRAEALAVADLPD